MLQAARQTRSGLHAQMAALAAGAGRRTAADDVWIYLSDPRMPALEHGWKLHISTRPEELAATVDLVVPVLLRYVCDAKVAAGAGLLTELNAGLRGAAAVGKAMTVYPRGQDVAALGRELAELLAGRTGPRVLSDRRVRADAPVHYRYGPFRVAGAADGTVMEGPGGMTFPGPAGTRYGQPPWAEDPFGDRPGERPRSGRLIGGRHRLTAGIARSPQGDVYRALDTLTGGRVVVKQARAYAMEDAAGVDARGRLRHERDVLAALDGVEGVPRLVDHVRHGEDEFLVLTDCGPVDLWRDVRDRGPWTGGDRDPLRLARSLLRVLDAVHARGVVARDLKPGNVVLAPDGGCSLVDFGISALHGVRPDGATPGYGVPGTGRAPEPDDDHYALGATLVYALTGMDPVRVDGGRAVNRDRTLAGLSAALPGAGHAPVLALVAGLMSLRPGERAACARRLREGAAPAPRRLPSPPRITAGLLEDLVANTAARLARDCAALPAAGSPAASSPLAVYEGAAGAGTELLHHSAVPGVADAVAGLARRTATRPERTTLPEAVYTGRTGVELFLAAAGASAGCAPPDAPGEVRGGDQICGAAGAGTGHLLLARQAGPAGRPADAAAHLAAAGRYAGLLLAGGPPDPEDLWRPAPRSAAAYADGFAHGRAGVVHFLWAWHLATGDAAAGAAAGEGLAALAAAVPGLLTAAAHPAATPRFGSWCRGLAGIGSVLMAAGAQRGDPRLTARAVDCARAVRRSAPRMASVSQCCGLAGAGELLVDAASATGDPVLWRQAREVAALVLARSGGSARRPVLPDNSLCGTSPGWATGTAGVLTFLRRLRDGGGPRPYLCG